MDGRGVTNYSLDKPSYGFSTATSEFDDALISRGVVTFEQAMIAKGASPEEARRLANLKFNTTEEERCDQVGKQHTDNDQNQEATSDDEEEFIRNYRQQRIKELKSSEKVYLEK